MVKEGQVISKDSRSHETFVHGIKVLMAKNFSDNLSEEGRKGLQEKVAEGGYPRSAPMGDINNLVDKTIEIDPDVGPTIRQLFDWYGRGEFSIQSRRKKAKQAGLLEGFTKYKVSESSMHKMLQNAVYCGKVPFKGELFLGNHDPIVSESLVQKVQDILNGRSNSKGKYILYKCTGGKGTCSKLRKHFQEKIVNEQFAEAIKGIEIDDEKVAWVKEAEG